MSREENFFKLKKIFKINSEIDELVEKRKRLQEEIDVSCNKDNHMMVCYYIGEEYDCDDNFLGTTYHSKCLICDCQQFDYYKGLRARETEKGLLKFECFAEVVLALIYSKIDEANKMLKEECKYDSSVEKLEYISNILKEIGYTIDFETKTIIPITDK